ncbi:MULTISPECIES: DUF1697 domain-containing protein [Streptomyces]|uniref:DUF1697 domain-containing protein n=2 Tax=Streptomyces rimosus subsp. rimosus TaxID=132474 RepID=L8EL29_STRR1|nr:MULTISPECIES: DUF1697 domain-containing protein [Streptomyces]KOG80528.1 hypothetical protein ADK78_04670 [Kitasatospora aureofaciens]MYT44813.1 DUF1697 domain-containing protein [Streptomyces sp. SID5471]KEF03374.1 hypothetical protein DF17_29390 [Streptomyces rimosus]KEF17599.1 hypothetical protein DF18_28775 [Streptomyces rimosus]KOT30672.1 hypothetical protein ADK42_29710 [Streptomyces rimosus subsp. rimosus]
MPRQIALLRGINVGGHNKFPMARQRELFAALGHRDMTVLLQTGNIVFADPGTPPAETARRIEARIADELGFPVPVVVRTRDELAAAVAANPFPQAEAEPKTLHVTFLSDAPADPSPLKQLGSGAYAPDQLRLIGRELYMWCPNGVGRSKLADAVSRARLGVTATARNWNTVTKLLALADA